MAADDAYPLGATWANHDTAAFCVWAPSAQRVTLELVSGRPRKVRLARRADGYHTATVDQLGPDTRYWFRLDRNRRRADPASRFQPRGVGGPSQIVRCDHAWRDDTWQGLPLADYIIYELHVGCFSPTGDFDGVTQRLDTLAQLGITAIELMPLAQFPGARNWGYDGVFPYAVQNSYGGPAELKRLVDACHQRGIAVVLDVVYNHVGPEGNYLAEFGPYFTDRYHTPWGPAINFDGPDSDHVRRFFIENAVYWVRDFHIDALRLDAIQMIFDNSARPVLGELAAAVHAEGRRQGRQVHVIGETNQNDIRQVTSPTRGGLGLDAVWTDDFHRSVHALLTGERMAVYQDFGPLDLIGTALRNGFVLDGRYSHYHRRRHGSSSQSLPGHQLVVYLQNHDLPGNRLYGERLGHLVPFEQQKLAAGLLLLSPFVPFLFMGEEYGEPNPFLYFVDHADPGLIERVRRGRLADHPSFVRSVPVPDPGDEATFVRSKIDHRLRSKGRHRALWEFYQELIRLRKLLSPAAKGESDRPQVTCRSDINLLLWQRQTDCGELAVAFYFGQEAAQLDIELPRGRWTCLLDSADCKWLGPGTLCPATFESDGHVTLDVTGPRMILLDRQ